MGRNTSGTNDSPPPRKSTRKNSNFRKETSPVNKTDSEWEVVHSHKKSKKVRETLSLINSLPSKDREQLIKQLQGTKVPIPSTKVPVGSPLKKLPEKAVLSPSIEDISLPQLLPSGGVSQPFPTVSEKESIGEDRSPVNPPGNKETIPTLPIFRDDRVILLSESISSKSFYDNIMGIELNFTSDSHRKQVIDMLLDLVSPTNFRKTTKRQKLDSIQQCLRSQCTFRFRRSFSDEEPTSVKSDGFCLYRTIFRIRQNDCGKVASEPLLHDDSHRLLFIDFLEDLITELKHRTVTNSPTIQLVRQAIQHLSNSDGKSSLPSVFFPGDELVGYLSQEFFKTSKNVAYFQQVGEDTATLNHSTGNTTRFMQSDKATKRWVELDTLNGTNCHCATYQQIRSAIEATCFANEHSITPVGHFFFLKELQPGDLMARLNRILNTWATEIFQHLTTYIQKPNKKKVDNQQVFATKATQEDKLNSMLTERSPSVSPDPGNEQTIISQQTQSADNFPPSTQHGVTKISRGDSRSVKRTTITPPPTSRTVLIVDSKRNDPTPPSKPRGEPNPNSFNLPPMDYICNENSAGPLAKGWLKIHDLDMEKLLGTGVRTFGFIPYNNQPAIARQMSRIIGDCNLAYKKTLLDPSNRNKAIHTLYCKHMLLFLPMILKFDENAVKHGNKHVEQLLATRLHQWEIGNWEVLIDNLTKSTPTKSLSQYRGTKPKSHVDRKRKKAEYLISNHEIAKAYKTITSPDAGPVEKTQQTIDEMKTLFPNTNSLTSASNGPPLSTPESDDISIAGIKQINEDLRHLFTLEKVQNVIFQSKRSTAPGPLGISGFIWKTLIRRDINGGGRARKSLGLALTEFLLIMASGGLPPITMSWLNSARVFPLKKPNGKLRPICVTETITKFCSKVFTSHIHKNPGDVHKIFGCHQMGVARPNGIESIVHSITNLLLTDEELCVLSADTTNAFNSIHRGPIRQFLQNNYPLLLTWFDALYGNVTSNLYSNIPSGNLPYTIIQCMLGVYQGDPLSPFFFSGGIHNSVITKLQEFLKKRNLPGIVLAYLDDIFVVGPLSTLKEAYPELQRLLSEVGLSFNPAKSKILLRKPLTSDEQWIHNAKIPFYNDGIDILGAPIGFDTYIKRRTNEIIRDHVEEVSNLLTWEDTQLVFTLYRHCFLTKFNFYFRLILPYVDNEEELGPSSTFAPLKNVLKEHLSHFVQPLTFGMCASSRADIPDHAWDQATLSPKFGGLGFLDCDYGPIAAYLASLLDAHNLSSDIFLLFCGEEGPYLEKFIYTYASHIALMHSKLTQYTNNVLFNAKSNKPLVTDDDILEGEHTGNLEGTVLSSTDLFNPPSIEHLKEEDKIQKRLSRVLNTAKLQSYKDKHESHHYARVHSSGREGGLLITTVRDREGVFKLRGYPTVHFNALLCYRLGLPLPFFDQTPCICKDAVLDCLGHHAFTCKSGEEVQLRHRYLEIQWGAFLSDCGYSVTLEDGSPLRSINSKDNRRLDLIASIGNIQLSIDVTIASLPKDSSKVVVPGKTASDRERIKYSKYSDAVQQAGGRFIPVVLESHGAFGAQARKLFSEAIKTKFYPTTGGAPRTLSRNESLIIEGWKSKLVCIPLYYAISSLYTRLNRAKKNAELRRTYEENRYFDPEVQAKNGNFAAPPVIDSQQIDDPDL